MSEIGSAPIWRHERKNWAESEEGKETTFFFTIPKK